MNQETERERKESVDFISRLNGYGSLTSAQTSNLRGINVNRNGTAAPVNKDQYGFTFFTRPDLNLSYDNLGSDRMLSVLLSKDPRSMAMTIRAMLDPRGASSMEAGSFRSDIVDNELAFMPVLSNNLLSISGWPDVALDVYTSKPGTHQEVYSMVDSTAYMFKEFSLTANFGNIQGDPITLLMAVWTRYASLVYEGVLVPHFDNLAENTIDYQTRIYRLVMDSNLTTVQKIGACGAAFPIAAPLGASFDYSSEENFNDQNKQISIPFQSIGANYLDPILVNEFNQTVEYRCSGMNENNRNDLMRLVRKNQSYGSYGNIGNLLHNILSHRMYPRIDPYTMELQWYARRGDFDDAIRKLQKQNIIGTTKGIT